MDIFLNLLRNLKKNDKSTFNVLYIIAESKKGEKRSISKSVSSYYKEAQNKEEVSDFIISLVKKDEDYKKYFSEEEDVYRGSRVMEYLTTTHQSGPILDLPTINTQLPHQSGPTLSQDGGRSGSHSPNHAVHHPTSPVPSSVHHQSGPILSQSTLKGGNKKRIKEQEDSIFLKYYNSPYLNSLSPPPLLLPLFLYPPLQCKLCGLRYKDDPVETELMRLHTEEHIRKSRALEEKMAISREFFATLENWMMNMEKIVLNLKEVNETEKVVHSGVAYCNICSGKIPSYWDDKEEGWILEDCVCLEDDEEKVFCHKQCVL